MKLIKFCPYCGDGPKRFPDPYGCCGETDGHYDDGVEIEPGYCVTLEEYKELTDKNKEKNHESVHSKH